MSLRVGAISPPRQDANRVCQTWPRPCVRSGTARPKFRWRGSRDHSRGPALTVKRRAPAAKHWNSFRTGVYRRIRSDGGQHAFYSCTDHNTYSFASLRGLLRRKEPTTKKCKVVETVPTDKTWVQVGPLSFKTRDEADKQVTVICKEKHD